MAYRTQIFDARDLIAFPTDANNASDTLIGNVHFNLTILEYYNFTLYSNGTLSNGSRCLLTFEPYTPKLVFANGTFINSTSCYSAVNPIGARAKASIGFACAYGVLLVGILVCLSKHGRLFLPKERRFYPIGRRWQWYWGILTIAMALVSLITCIDVDRYYLPELPIVLTSFFWYLTQMCAMAIVWEAIRHWGSWQERQFIDPNPFMLGQDDRRAMFELLIPLVFYFFWWMDFFMVVPRNWGRVELQRSPEQTRDRAIPAATDARFKAAAFFLLASWITIIVSLRHSIRHYLPRNRGVFNRAIGLVSQTPFRFVVLLTLSLAMVAYQALCAWEFSYSVLNIHGNRLAIFLGGYAPSVLILIVQVLYGWVAPNEDRALIRQRRQRGEEQDRELGIVHKPAWWRRINGDFPTGNMRDRIARNVRELGGGRATAKGVDRNMDFRAHDREAMEMNDMPNLGRTTTQASFSAYGGKSDTRRQERTMQAAASLLFPSAAGDNNSIVTSGTTASRRAELMADGPPPSYRDIDSNRGRGRDGAAPGGGRNGRSRSSGSLASLSAEPQQVRSMLDI